MNSKSKGIKIFFCKTTFISIDGHVLFWAVCKIAAVARTLGECEELLPSKKIFVELKKMAVYWPEGYAQPIVITDADN